MSKKSITLASVSPSGKTYRTTKGKIISKSALLFLIKFNLAKVVTASGGEVFKHKTKVAKVNHKKGDYIRTAPNYKANDNISSLEVNSKLGVIEKKRKNILIGTMCGLLAGAVVLAPTTTYLVNGCNQYKYRITFDEHADELIYGGNMTLVATCTSDVAPTLTAEGDGKDVNWTFNPQTGVLGYTTEVFSNTTVTITATSPNAKKVKTQVTLVAHDTITIAAHPDTLAYGNNMQITASSNSGYVPTITATGDQKNTIWTFSNGYLNYISEKATNTTITITATAPNAVDVVQTITLIAHDTITFANHASGLAYGDNMTISATCATGAAPSLTAAGTGQGTIWTFVPATGVLSYISQSYTTAPLVTITATSPGANTVTTTVQLTPLQNEIILTTDLSTLSAVNDVATITATSLSGVRPTLSCSATYGQGSVWDFVWNFGQNTHPLTYLAMVYPDVLTVTITATLADAVTKTVDVELTPSAQPIVYISSPYSEIATGGRATIFTTCGDISITPTLSADGTDDDQWEFSDNGNGTGTLNYTGAIGTPVIITITAQAPGAEDVSINITLLAVNILTFADHEPTLMFDESMAITATSSTSADVELTASGSGRGEVWEFVSENGSGTLEYLYPVEEALDVTITATSPGASDVTTIVTLVPSNTITLLTDTETLESGAKATLTATCTSGAEITFTTSSNPDLYDDQWSFDPYTSTLEYYGECFETIDVTITAHSQYAPDVSVVVTLLPSNTITLLTDTEALESGAAATLNATCTSGAEITFTTSSSPNLYDDQWSFDPDTLILEYSGECFEAVDVTITAHSQYAPDVSVVVTLLAV